MSWWEKLQRWWSGPGPAPASEPAFRERQVLCASAGGLHRMAYTEWGDPANPKVLVCVHGLTRNGRDFDALAQEMAGEYRVICPDVVGRGRSEVLADKNAYGFPQYIADMVTLLARLDVTEVHWVGTSMGGLIGMFLASMAKTPITRLVLNDVGPLVTAESLRRIAEYVGKPVAFSSYREGEAYLRLIGAPFGEMDDAQWDNLCRYALQEGEDGLWRPAYDPGLAEPFRKTFVFQNVDLWPVYEGIACPTLVIRGAESDLLLRDTWQRMGERGPKAQLAEVPGVGHAPMFQTAGQIALVREFLLQP